MSYRRLLVALGCILVLVALDQIVKHQITIMMALGERIDLLPFLSLYHTRNSGVAFSLLSSFHDIGLIVLTIAVIAFVLWLWWETGAHNKLAHAGYLLIIGGALGNLIDRIRFHYVTDYVLFHLGDWSFAVFNLADVFITIGAALIIFNEFLSWYREKCKHDRLS